MLDLHKDIEKLKEDWKFQRKQSRVKEESKTHKEQKEESNRIEDRYFDLLKNSTILSGTIFASSIALVSGRDVSLPFVIGELMLLVSTICGVLYLWSRLKSREWAHFMSVKGHLDGDMLINKDIMEDFEKEAIQSLINDYKRLMERRSILDPVFRVIKVDWLPGLFYLSLLTGLILIWLSLFC